MREDLATWLERIGLAQYATLFAKADVDPRRLPRVTDRQLEQLGVDPSHWPAILNAALAVEDGRVIAQRVQDGIRDPTRLQRDDADRRPLTVLFCDLVNSVQLSNAVDPEDFRLLLSLYRRTCGLPIERFGGFVARYIGDGILAYFGYPSAHEDDAERAIRAGLEILTLMKDFKSEPSLYADTDLAVRIGIASGPVVVGKITAGAAAEEVEVTGEAPNLAARLHAFATPGTMIVDPLTRHLATDRFHYAALGKQSLKGFDQPISVWRVLGERATSRFGARRRRQTPLVGREEHLASLTACWHKILAGKGQAALICGKAGIGKSRLAEALRDFVLSSPTNKSEAMAVAIRLQCSPYHANASLFPVIRVLERFAEFEPRDTAARKLQKLSNLLAESQFADPQEALGLLENLLALSTEKSKPALAERSETRLRQLRLLLQWIELLASQRPVLVTWEDVQWIDPTSRQLLEQLLVSAKKSAVFVIATLRTEPGSDQIEKANFQFSDWISRSDIRICALDELTQEQGRQLARNVARGKNLPDSLARAIAERGQGNPLFIEELTRGWLTAETSDHEFHPQLWQAPATIPDTLSGALMARVDQTGPLREIVLHAAVIGGEFNTLLVSTAANLPQDFVRTGLARLVEGDILSSTRNSGEPSYFFKHALVQEVAYASLLKSRRKEIHQMVAGALAGNEVPSVQATHDFIAQHFAKGGDAANAIQHWKLAAEEASARSAQQEAANILQRALDLLPELSDGQERRLIELDLVVASAIALQSVRGFAAPEVEGRYLTAQGLSEAVHGSQHGFNIEWGLFLTTLVKGNMAEADAITARLFACARADHPTRLSDAHLAKGMVALNLGEFRNAHNALTRSMELVPYGPDSVVENAFGQLPWNFCASQLSFTLWFEGFKRASNALVRQNLHVAHNHFKGSVRAYNYVATLAWAVRVYQCRRDSAEVQRLTNEIISISRKFGYAYYDAQATAYLGWAIAVSEHDPERGIAMMHSGLSALKFAKTELGLRGHFIHLAEALCRLGRKSEAVLALESAGGAGGRGTRCWDAEFHRVRALIHFLGPVRDEMEAERDLRQSLIIAQSQKSKALELRTAVTCGRYLLGEGRVPEAKLVLTAALKDTAENEDDAERAEVKALLAGG